MNTPEFREIETMVSYEKLARIKSDEKRKRSMEKQRTLCKHIPMLINRDDIQELVGEYKRRIGKLILDSYQTLCFAVRCGIIFYYFLSAVC